MTKTLFLAATLLTTIVSTSAHAAVVLGPTVGGVATFTDTTTGRNWARLDTYFDKSHDQMAADIAGKGFTVALTADVDALLGTLPLNNGEWTGYAAIMGRAPNRDLIWGSFAPVSQSGMIGWSFAFSSQNAWTTNLDVFPSNVVPNGGGSAADMNIWAFASGNVPEPASWAMMITGFGLIGSAMRRRATAVAI